MTTPSRSPFVLRALLSSLLAGLTLAACSTTILAEDFDQSCTVDDDCVTVGVGDICECSCDQGAISASEIDRYNADRGSIECSVDCGVCPELLPATCTAGVCQVDR